MCDALCQWADCRRGESELPHCRLEQGVDPVAAPVDGAADRVDNLLTPRRFLN